jgi:hypothetical protein
VLLLGALATFGVARAETLVVDSLDQAKHTAAQRPTRGMTMNKVNSAWGAPVVKNPAVGQPPITRWEYNDFVVFFEYDRVLHAVVKHP